ncbi:DNA polymerase III subunit delta [Pararhizobium sp.]|uniref:DNA polymerase III subunit delta n=1 Tax=Pararhizobium sp. TaxID=1977563 RepID=UPI002720433D|nr:DNA polymerase III subunit delta [Pararhizobium sp.]MDO9416789.1 DNA polymerase III subunit delta [Pararhizobium sp.]
MTEIKSHEFDGFLQRSVKRQKIFLVYGPDRGLVSERAAQIASGLGVALDDPFSTIKMDVSDLQSDPGRLIDEVLSIGLFGGDKLVWVRGAANEKALVDGLETLVKNKLDGAFLLIEAGDLKKGSALRKTSETASTAVAIPCYADDARALNALIDSELSLENLTITPAGRQLLLDGLGGDRIASRNEIRKVALYCRGLETIDEQQIMEIVGDASAISTDDAVDAVLQGDRDALLLAVRKISTSKTPIFLVLQGCLRQLQLLDLMRSAMDEKRETPSQVIAALGRHLHFRRKPIIERALKKWTLVDLRRDMQRIQAAILQSRSRAALEESIAVHALLSITIQAAQR